MPLMTASARVSSCVTLCAAAALTVIGCRSEAPPNRAANRGGAEQGVQAVDAQGAPLYRVDPFWPKPLPNKWSMQQIVDIAVDRDDHVWIINRRVDARPDELTAATTPPRGECCVLGPEVLEFDPAGNVVNAWGGPDYHPGWPGRL